MAAKRVLFVVHSYYVRDTRPRRLANALTDAGWDVDVVCARERGEARRETIRNVRILRLPARRLRGTKSRYLFEYVSFAFMALFAVAARWSARRYQVVYVIGVPNFIVFATLIPK